MENVHDPGPGRGGGRERGRGGENEDQDGLQRSTEHDFLLCRPGSSAPDMSAAARSDTWSCHSLGHFVAKTHAKVAHLATTGPRPQASTLPDSLRSALQPQVSPRNWNFLSLSARINGSAKVSLPGSSPARRSILASPAPVLRPVLLPDPRSRETYSETATGVAPWETSDLSENTNSPHRFEFVFTCVYFYSPV